jgi:hypothetical protein
MDGVGVVVESVVNSDVFVSDDTVLIGRVEGSSVRPGGGSYVQKIGQWTVTGCKACDSGRIQYISSENLVFVS